MQFSCCAFLRRSVGYIFFIYHTKSNLCIKKIGNEPVASTPTPASNAAYASFASTVVFPYAITKDFVEALNALTIDTTAAGVQSGTMTFAVVGEGVKPSVSFTITTDVAA